MSNLAMVSVFFGILILVGRAPLIFAPAATLRIIHKVIGKKSNLRLMGIPTFLLGVAIITSALETDLSFAFIIIVLGCFIVAAGALEIIATSFVQRIAIAIWGMSPVNARILGLVSVVLGAYFIYLGYNVF
ncbi:MAG: hypothetical protein HKM93_02995 [Desulfobacteraceae bacterium]|nr:hypothetical protein [Desulfobacteraceae bacterium]